MHTKRYTYVHVHIAARNIQSATETAVLVTWPNIIDLPMRYICQTSSLTEPPACDSGEDMPRTYVRVYTQKRASHMCICTHNEMCSISSHSRIQYRASEPLDSWILDDCVSRGKSLALSPTKLTKGSSRRARFTCCTCCSERNVIYNENECTHVVKLAPVPRRPARLCEL